MNITLDVNGARNALLRVVARFGRDHKASSSGGGSGCTYAEVVNGVLTPVCIVGQVVADYGLLGVLVDTPQDFLADGVREPEQHGACNLNNGMWDALDAAGLHFTEDAKTYLRSAQEAQDNGVTWGRAVEYADEKFITDAANDARSTLGLPMNFGGPLVSNFLGETVEDALSPVDSPF